MRGILALRLELKRYCVGVSRRWIGVAGRFPVGEAEGLYGLYITDGECGVKIIISSSLASWVVVAPLPLVLVSGAVVGPAIAFLLNFLLTDSFPLAQLISRVLFFRLLDLHCLFPTFTFDWWGLFGRQVTWRQSDRSFRGVEFPKVQNFRSRLSCSSNTLTLLADVRSKSLPSSSKQSRELVADVFLTAWELEGEVEVLCDFPRM